MRCKQCGFFKLHFFLDFSLLHCEQFWFRKRPFLIKINNYWRIFLHFLPSFWQNSEKYCKNLGEMKKTFQFSQMAAFGTKNVHSALCRPSFVTWQDLLEEPEKRNMRGGDMDINQQTIAQKKSHYYLPGQGLLISVKN